MSETRRVLTIEMELDADGDWIVTSPNLDGCIADGDTPERALLHWGSALEAWMEATIEAGQKL